MFPQSPHSYPLLQNITNAQLWAPTFAASSGLFNQTLFTYEQTSGNNVPLNISINMPWVQGRAYTRCVYACVCVFLSVCVSGVFAVSVKCA